MSDQQVKPKPSDRSQPQGSDQQVEPGLLANTSSLH
jgi:hypothetical protein